MKKIFNGTKNTHSKKVSILIIVAFFIFISVILAKFYTNKVFLNDKTLSSVLKPRASSILAAVNSSAKIPQGVFSLTAPGKPVSSDILNNSLVSGVSVRWRWQEVEKSEGVYNWSYFDTEIARVAAAGKKVLLRITAGGRNTPQWVFNAGVQTVSFINTNPYDGSYNSTTTIPVFWDPIFLQKKDNFIIAMGKHFAGNPNIILVSESCANTLTDDWGMGWITGVNAENFKQAGYTSEKLINSCKKTTDTVMAAFPSQFMLMGVGRTGSLEQDPDYVAREVVAYARNSYPGRFITQKNALSAKTPDPAISTKLGNWQVVYDSRPETAGQMLWYATNDATCRMNNGIKPCDAATMLNQAVAIGSRYGMNYQEIYQQDILNPALANVIKNAADILTKPLVSITSPANNAELAASTKITLEASDFIGVSKVELYRDNLLLTTFTAPPFEFVWDIPKELEGQHALTAIAYDNSGNKTASQPITVLINHNSPPVITPIGDKTISEGRPLNFTVSAQDPDGDTLVYSVDTLPTGASFDSNTHIFDWIPNFQQAGSYTLAFTVNDGKLSDSEIIAITVANVIQAETPWQNKAYGKLYTDLPYNYAMGYHFTPKVDGKVTKLGGFFKGTKKVKLFNKATGQLLAETNVTSDNNWSYADIAPVNVSKDTIYTVAVYLAGSGASYRYQLSPVLPVSSDNVTIKASTYIYTGYTPNARPQKSVAYIMYGQADIGFVPNN